MPAHILCLKSEGNSAQSMMNLNTSKKIFFYQNVAKGCVDAYVTHTLKIDRIITIEHISLERYIRFLSKFQS